MTRGPLGAATQARSPAPRRPVTPVAAYYASLVLLDGNGELGSLIRLRLMNIRLIASRAESWFLRIP